MAAKRTTEILRRAPWIIAAITVLAVGLVVRDYRRQHKVVAEQVREQNLIKMRGTKRHIESYLGQIRMDLNFISKEDAVVRMTPESRDYIQAVFQENYGQHRLSDIYVVERGFDGMRRPFMTFGLGSRQEEVPDLHSLERERDEYRVHVEQLRSFEDDPSLDSLISMPVSLCVGRRGVVLSVPIRSDEGLVGLVAAMIPLENISRTLERSNLRDFQAMVILANERGQFFGCTELDEGTVRWFETRFAARGVREFFESQQDSFRVGGKVALWTTADLPGARQWHLAYLYDEAAYLKAGGVGGTLAAAGTGGLVLAFGALAIALCRGLRRRLVAETALRESEQKYRTLFEESRDAVYFSTPRGRFVDVNLAGVELFGYASKEELLEVDIGRDLYIDPLERARTNRVMAEQGYLMDHELSLKTKDGRRLRVLVTSTAVRDKNGEVVLYRGILRDVTGQRELEGQLRQAQKMEAVGTLASGIAHDFNNLLTVILGHTELAKATLLEGHQAIPSLDMIERAARQAGGVTKSLLTFGRKGISEKRPVDMCRITNEALRLLRHVLPASVELVQSMTPDSDIWVNADATQMQQVLMNLVVNARDAMPDGGRLTVKLHRKPRHMVSTAPTGPRLGLGEAVLVVEDTGEGMPAEVQQRVFEPFFTTKPRGQGTGLGLSLIHGIVTDHLGRIELHSAPGRGTRVRITIPCCKTPAPAADQEAPELKKKGHGEVIIVAESSDHIRSIMTSTLRSQGYDVVQAADGVEAMAAFQTHQAIVRPVILELDLAHRSGLSCLRDIHRDRPDLPVVVVSGRVDSERIEALPSESQGACILLRKPFRMADLAETVSGGLSKAEGGVHV